MNDTVVDNKTGVRAGPSTARARGAEHRRWYYLFGFSLLSLGFMPQKAQASMFHGETLDTIADVISWIVLIVVPVVLIAVFWIVHILPEKIAHKKHHPQTPAIQTLCLLSLFFGGILWPLAWIWAYTKPVMYKMAYGTDVDSHGKPAEIKVVTPVEELPKRKDSGSMTPQVLTPRATEPDGKGGKV